MNIVFYNFFYSASAPKCAMGIIDLIKRTSGSIMRKEYLKKYIAMLKWMIEETNTSGRHAKIEISLYEGKHYNDDKVHGQISVYNMGQYGKKDIARIDYIEEGYGWQLDKYGDIRIMVIKNNVDMETKGVAKNIWHKMTEDADPKRFVVLSDKFGHISQRLRWPFAEFVRDSKKKDGIIYTKWAYQDEIECL